jgi:hypothetical protein
MTSNFAGQLVNFHKGTIIAPPKAEKMSHNPSESPEMERIEYNISYNQQFTREKLKHV